MKRRPTCLGCEVIVELIDMVIVKCFFEHPSFFRISQRCHKQMQWAAVCHAIERLQLEFPWLFRKSERFIEQGVKSSDAVLYAALFHHKTVDRHERVCYVQQDYPSAFEAPPRNLQRSLQQGRSRHD